jgi:hypothetical protein
MDAMAGGTGLLVDTGDTELGCGSAPYRRTRVPALDRRIGWLLRGDHS